MSIAMWLFFLLFSLIGICPISPAGTSSSTSESVSSTADTVTTVGLPTTENILPPPPGNISKCEELPLNITFPGVIHCEGSKKLMFLKDGGLIDLSEATQDQIDYMFHNTGGKELSFKSNFQIKASNIKTLKVNIMVDKYKFTVNIENNDYLHDLYFKNSDVSNRGELTMNIRCNRRLSIDSIEKLKLVERGVPNIQSFGECCVNNPKSFKELDACHYISGDLNMAGNIDTTSVFPSELQNITGCIKIKNSNIKDVDFLLKINTDCKRNEISGNNELCLNSEKISEIKGHMDVNIDQPKTCKDKCTWKWTLQSKDNTNVKCQILKGDVIITGIDDEAKLSYLDHVEEIYGQLVVHDNTFTKYTILPKLRKVEISDTGKHVIHIYNNPNLGFFNFSSLKKLIAPNDTKAEVLAVDNAKKGFVFSEEEYKDLERLGRIRVPLNQSTIIAIHGGNETRRNTTRNPDSNVVDSGKTGDEDGSSTGKIIGWSVGGGGALVVVIILIVVALVLYFVLSKKKKNKKGKKDDMKSTMSIIDYNDEPNNLQTFGGHMTQVQVGETLKKEQNTRFLDFNEDEKLYFAECQQRLIEGPKMANLSVSHLKVTPKKDVTFISDKLDYEKAKNSVEKMLTGHQESVWPCEKSYVCYTYNPLKLNWRSASVENCANIDDYLRICFSTDDVDYGAFQADKGIGMVLNFVKGHDYSGDNSNLVEVTGPCHIVGSPRGSMSDLLAILSMDPKGVAETTHPALYYKFIFTGGYLRDSKSLHLTLFLLALAKRQANKIILLRGPSENDFNKDMAIKMFPANYKEIYEVLEPIVTTLPAAAVVNSKVLVTSGGPTDSMTATNDLAVFKAELGKPNESDEQDKMALDLIGSSPSHLSHPRTENAYGCFFNRTTVDNMCQKYRWSLIVTNLDFFCIPMGPKVVCVSGGFDGRIRKDGLVETLKKQNEEFVTELSSIPSAGTLRIESDGRLTVLLLRHSYNKQDFAEFKQKFAANGQ